MQLGFGDVLDDAQTLAELDARAIRVAQLASTLPRFRNLDDLLLDLFHRDGYVGDTRLGLHPREFALLWRLSDCPGIPVSQAELLADVWQMNHSPETNRVAVHVFRLRAKLAIAGIERIVQTTGDGSYVYVALASRTSPLMLNDAALDETRVLREDEWVSGDQGACNGT